MAAVRAMTHDIENPRAGLADGLASSRERTVAWRREQNSNRRLTKSIVPGTGALEFAGRFVPSQGRNAHSSGTP